MAEFRPVFDTNALISTTLWPSGVTARSVGLCQRPDVRSITCNEILSELREKLILKFQIAEDEADTHVTRWRDISTLVAISGRQNLSPDPDDDMVLDCAAVAGATR